jgi:polyisoprenoid-binding protein YceI
MTKLAFTLAVACLSLKAFAGSQSFDFKEPAGINKIVVCAGSASSHISSTATNVCGNVTFDPDQPSALKGRIVVESSSFHAGTASASASTWLEVDKFPQIVLETTSVKNARVLDDGTNIFMADVSGTITLRGVSKNVTVPVKICYIRDRLRERNPQLTGDLLRINANFTLQRSDFDPRLASGSADKSANTIQVNFSISGQCPRQPAGAAP